MRGALGGDVVVRGCKRRRDRQQGAHSDGEDEGKDGMCLEVHGVHRNADCGGSQKQIGTASYAKLVRRA
jgi:hypothetical protein